MRQNRAASIAININEEGGLVERATEPGGMGKYGVSFVKLAEFRRKHGKPPPTVDDLRNLTVEEATALYNDTADEIGFDVLSGGVDHAALEAAINEGVTFAKALLIVTAIHKADPMKRVRAMSDVRLAVKRLRSDWDDHDGIDKQTGATVRVKGFGVGWTRRIAEWIPAEAAKMMSG